MIQKGDAGLEIDKERYKRNILLPEVGEEGQKKLSESRGGGTWISRQPLSGSSRSRYDRDC